MAYESVDNQQIQKFDSAHSNRLWKMNRQTLHGFLYCTNYNRI